MKTYTLKLSSGTTYKLYDGTTPVSDTDLGTLFGSAGSAYFVFDFNSSTPSATTSVTITDSSDATVMGITGLADGTVKEDYNFKGEWDGTSTTFDSFAELPGQALDEAQLGFLMGKIKESLGNLGKTRELTSADYDYPTTGTADGIAMWLLPSGVYTSANGGPKLYWNPNMSGSTTGGIFVHRRHEFAGNKFSSVTLDIPNIVSADSPMYLRGYGSYSNQTYNNAIPAAIQNNLVTGQTYGQYSALSAYQGKVLKDLIDSLVVKNSGAPTTSTVGTVGMLLEDTTNGKLYICTAVSGSTYTWTEVGAGGSGPTVVQTTGTSTTDVMSQDAVTSMVFADPSTKERIRIGSGATSAGTRTIAIGTNSVANDTNTTAAGAYAEASTLGSTALGTAAYAKTPKAYYATALGSSAQAKASGSVALGSHSMATVQGEVNIGSSNTSYGYSSSNYRLLSGLYDGQSAHDAATVGQAVGTTETYAIATSDWSALSSSSPYTYQATVTATYTIGASTLAELLNDSPVDFATYGFAIGSISSQSVTIYSIGQPSASVSLKVNYKG